MFRKPELLKAKDIIRIISPAKAIEPEVIEFAVNKLRELGFEVQISTHCSGKYNYFSGTLNERLSDMQDALDAPDVKAILCARGGYGSVQLVDKLNWERFDQNPKWIIGFSDITVFHQRLAKAGIESIHATMPLNFKENSSESLETLVNSLMSGYQSTIEAIPQPLNIEGEAKGILIGGNASIVYSTLGTNDQPDYSGKILFLEDLSEQLYHIDRIFHSLKKSGVLGEINGLIIGGMTDMKDTQDGFGQSLEEIIHHHVAHYRIPLAFQFPAGHIEDNRALIFGDLVTLSVQSETVVLSSENNNF
jgi:muramoyltetrapeptide carboxypeptidase